MRSTLTQVSIAFAVIILCQSQELEKDNDDKKNSGAVYLIDTLDGTKSATDQSGNVHKASYELVDPIPINKAGDGVYFRPASGKPLAEPQVYIFLI